MLADTDRKALKFIFTSDPNSDLPEDIFRDLIFQVIVTSKVYKRFDSSQKFSDILGVRKTSRQKKLGYYEIENMITHAFLTLAVNPKEYLEILKNLHQNKKQKGIKKGSFGLGFENYSETIKSSDNFETFEKSPTRSKRGL